MSDTTYVIRVFFETGNSFGRHDEEQILELTWKNLDVAKKNLQRIKEHYEWYEYENRSSWYKKTNPKVECPKWLKSIKKSDRDYYIIFKTDDGKDWQIAAYWCGYFERLHRARIEIEPKENRDMEISF